MLYLPTLTPDTTPMMPNVGKGGKDVIHGWSGSAFPNATKLPRSLMLWSLATSAVLRCGWSVDFADAPVGAVDVGHLEAIGGDGTAEAILQNSWACLSIKRPGEPQWPSGLFDHFWSMSLLPVSRRTGGLPVFGL